MKQKLLITGGSGFVAYHIIVEALKQQYDVYVSVRSSSGIGHLKELDIKYTSINFDDVEDIKKELKEKQYNYIIHTAGTTKAKSKQEYDRVNATYTNNLARAASTAGIPLKKFVFLSSLAAVGPSDNVSTTIGDSMYSPVTDYGKSKLLAEQMLAEIKDLPFIIVRPTAVYGPREKDILIVFRTLNKGLEPYIGSKPQQLSFIYVKDLAQIVINALTAPVNGKAYNISDGNLYDRFALATITKSIIGKRTFRFQLPVAVVKLVAVFLEAAGALTAKTPALNGQKIKELTASWVCNIDAAKQDLDFKPVYDLEAGLKETLLWYKENKWL
jgi:nucleoside-diphosphate-sugar epimerase